MILVYSIQNFDLLVIDFIARKITLFTIIFNCCRVGLGSELSNLSKAKLINKFNHIKIN